MNTKVKVQFRIMCISIMAILMLCHMFYAISTGVKANAVEHQSATLYSDDGITVFGEGVTSDDDRHIYYDYKVVDDANRVYTAPSYGNTDNTMSNVCGPVAGTNILGYYDRWHSNLIPNFSPGMMNYGKYEYFPNLNFTAIEETIRNSYRLMGTNASGPGTSQKDFQNGLKTAASNRGYNLSYSSFYRDTKTVKLDALKNAVSNNKVGVIFCNTFNFVYDICDNSAGTETIVIKINSTAAHIMMVYGFRTISYYKNGINFLTNTYLQVSSGFGTADLGYILLNDYLQIMDAQIVNIA